LEKIPNCGSDYTCKKNRHDGSQSIFAHDWSSLAERASNKGETVSTTIGAVNLPRIIDSPPVNGQVAEIAGKSVGKHER